jgi:hypothetical protein
LIEWGVAKPVPPTKLIYLFCGLGDNLMFTTVLPKIKEKYAGQKITIATEFPDLYKNSGCEVVGLTAGAQIAALQGRHVDDFNIYKYCIDHNWQRHLTEAFWEMYQ